MRLPTALLSARFIGCILATFSLTACGSSPKPATTPAPAAPTAVEEEGGPASGQTSSSPASSAAGESGSVAHDSASHGLPTACANPAASVCTPPSDFVDRLCAKPHQDAALALFGKATPFTRLYLRGKLDELIFDEEVLALRFHEPSKTGMVVGSGNGTYDVLRWDGSCSTAVEGEMLSRTRPHRARSALVKWHRMDVSVQDRLLASSDAVKKAHTKRGKECKGATSGEVSAACEKADHELVDAVVEYVRSGGALPPIEAP